MSEQNRQQKNHWTSAKIDDANGKIICRKMAKKNVVFP